MSGAEPKIVFHYLPNRGYGETARLILAYSGEQWKDDTVTTREDFVRMCDSGLLEFGQLPMLEMDGKIITQSQAMIRYLAHKFGLYGGNAEDRLKIDQAYEGARDFAEPFIYLNFRGIFEEELEKIETKIMPRYMPIFERILSENSGRCSAGCGTTIADIKLLEALLYVRDYFKAKLDQSKILTTFLAAMESEKPSLEKYLKANLRPVNAKEVTEKICGILGIRYD